MPFPDYTPTVPVFIRTLTERHGDRPFMVLGDRRLTYRDADTQSARLALGLIAAGVSKGSHVGVLMPNGPDWVIAWLAAARIGARVVPLNTFYQARELGWVLKHADVHVLLTVSHYLSHDYLARLEQCAPGLSDQAGEPLRLQSLPQLRSVRVFGRGVSEGEARPWARPGGDALAALADSEPELDDAWLRAVEDCITPADPMIMVYTSGSTADPKAAIHTHGSMLRHAFHLNTFRDIGGDDRVYSPMPFFWVGGLVFSLLSAMHAGACLLCEEVFEPGATLDLIESEKATIVSGWPHYAKALAEHPTFSTRDLSSIRSGNLYAVLPESKRPGDPELRWNSLGMTETCGPHTIEKMDEHEDLPEKWRGAFGRSVPGVEHKIVAEGSDEPLPPETSGEICVRGYSLMQGLYKVEREQTFDRDGYYHTGDGGRFNAEGILFFEARLGELIKTGGANVTPREVEVVLESQPEIKQAHIVGLPDPDRGQRVAAAVVLQAGAALEAEALTQRIKRELSAYKVPRHIVFFGDGELPFTDSGKIDKRSLEKLLTARIADA